MGGTQGVISCDNKSEGFGLCYQIDGGSTWLSMMDCMVLEAAPEQVISLLVSTADDGALSVACCNMIGSEIATFNDLQNQTLDALRGELENHLRVASDRFMLVLPDGRLMAKEDGGNLSISDLLIV